MPGPRSNRSSYTLGSRASSRRVSREAGVAATQPRTSGEGIPGSGAIEGQMRAASSRRRNRRRALRRIEKVYDRAPKALKTDPDVRLNARDPREIQASASARPETDVIKISEGTTAALSGEWGQGPQKDAQKTFLHELEHTAQGGGGLPDWLQEGTAELSARKNSKKMFGYRDKSAKRSTYQSYVEKVKKRGGGRLIKKARNAEPNAATLAMMKKKPALEARKPKQTVQTVNATLGSKDQRKPRNYTTTSGKITALRGTPVPPTKGVPLAAKRAEKVEQAMARVQKAQNSGPSLKGLSGPERQMAKAAIPASKAVGGDVPASVLTALSGQESNFGQNQGPSSAGARGVTQFIPGTRDSFIQEHGVDAWKNAKSGMKASALYLKELNFEKDPQGALSGYSGGYAASDYNNPILQDSKRFRQLDSRKPKVKADPKDVKLLARAGVDPKAAGKASSTPTVKNPNKRPFKGTLPVKGGLDITKGMSQAKWDKIPAAGHGDTVVNKAIAPIVKAWSRKFNVALGEGFAPPPSDHESAEHLETGTATDVYPPNDDWGNPKLMAKFNKGLKVLTDAGVEVLYDGQHGTTPWPNHGEGNHAHIIWLRADGGGGEALQKLTGMTNQEIANVTTSVGTGGGSSAPSGATGGSVTASSGTGGGGFQKKKKGLSKTQRLQKVRSGFTTSSVDADLADLTRRYGAPAV